MNDISAMQIQKAVKVYFSSKQLKSKQLSFGFADQGSLYFIV